MTGSDGNEIAPQMPPAQVFRPALTFVERHDISPILFAYLSLAVIFLLYQIVGGGLTLLLFGLKPTMDNADGFRVATGAAQILLILIPTLILARAVSRVPLQFLSLKLPRPALLVPAIVGMLSLQQLMQIVLTLQERIPLPESVERISTQFRSAIEEAYRLLVTTSTVPELLLVLVIVACIPAVAEELLFRGLIQKSLQSKFSPAKAAIVTGVIFGAYHLNPFAFIGLAAIGIYLGMLTARSGSIVLAMGAHFVNNAMAVLSMHFAVAEDAIITGDTGTMSYGWMLASGLLLLGIFATSMGMILHFTRTSPSPVQFPEKPI
jgi:membrane protease YdiL (CAAX protease family)